MESTIRRSRSTRNNYSRRKKGLLENEKKATKVLKQILICITIFAIIITIKNIDTSFTNYISNKTRHYLNTDTQISELTGSFNSIISGLSISNEKLRNVFNGYAPMNSKMQEESNIPETIKDKIFDHTLLSDIEFATPTIGILTSGFGTRINPITNMDEFHNAIDISANEGDEIKTVLDGVVIEVNSSESYGNYIRIRHPNDLISLYAHAFSIDIKEGELVTKGDVIGKVGSTGWSNGPHLHFELWKNDKMIDVEKLFNSSGSEVEYN